MKAPLTLLLALAIARLPAADSWAFNPAEDQFSANVAVDLRALNEREAGEKGFVHRSADGDGFVLGDGTPVRFWGINSLSLKPENMERQAKFLAKRGVNLVRFGAIIAPNLKKNPNALMADIDRDTLDLTWRWISALKKAGIYSTVVPYWAGGTIPASWDIKDHQSENGVLFCDRTFQDGYKAWMRALYGEKNPYTGVPLAQETEIAVIQIQNEDSLLWWSLDKFLADKGQPWDALRHDFGAFVTKKHGSIEKGLEYWENAKAEGDEAADGRLGFFKMWEMMHPKGGEGNVARASDQLEFLAREMRQFNTSMATFLREELGCKQLINACNWRGADMVRLNDCERWSYGGNEAMAVNRYFSPYHAGLHNGWAIEPGSQYINGSITLDPSSLPMNIKQAVGMPFMLTETNWTTPNLYQAEAPVMGAAYSSLSGLDAVCWVGTNEPGYVQPTVAWPDGKHFMYKWHFATPTDLGQFPAAAWLFRRGYASMGETVVHEERALDDLWRQRTPLLTEESGFDPNPHADLPAASAVKTTVDPLAFLVGRVEVVYEGDPAKSRVRDLAKYIDKDKQVVASTTGEERIDYQRGLFTLDAPKAQAAAGFLAKAGPVALHDVTITCSNPYAAITAVALDDRPLASSRKVLVQIGTTARPKDWQEHEADFKDPNSGKRMHGFVVDNIGGNPWQVACATGSVVIKNAALATATTHDANFMRSKLGDGKQEGGVFTLTLPADALYVLVEAK